MRNEERIMKMKISGEKWEHINCIQFNDFFCQHLRSDAFQVEPDVYTSDWCESNMNHGPMDRQHSHRFIAFSRSNFHIHNNWTESHSFSEAFGLENVNWGPVGTTDENGENENRNC